MALMRLNTDYGDCDSSLSSEEQGEMFFKRDLAFKGVLGEKPLAVGKTTNERVRGTIMSMELAFQRELEYRKKIERLKQKPAYDCKEPPVSVQEALSYPELGERSRESSFDNVSCSQGRMSDPMFFKRELERERLQEEVTVREVTDRRVERNIIPMDHVSQRVLGYRRKVESLQRQPCTKFQEPPITFQGSSPSNLGTVGIKRKAPSDDLTCLLPQQVQQACRQQSPETQLANLYCKECEVFCPSASNLKQHYEGRKHKSRLEELKYETNNGKKEVGLLWCNLCSIPCMNQLCYQQHLAGKKHAISVQAIKNARTVGGKSAGVEVPLTNCKPIYDLSLL